jgi:hypothetical protein
MIPQPGFYLNTSRGPRNQATASTTGVVTQKIAPALQAFQTKYRMTSAIASTIDAFIGQYTSYAQDAKEVFIQILNIGEIQIVSNRELEGLALLFEYAAQVATPL